MRLLCAGLMGKAPTRRDANPRSHPSTQLLGDASQSAARHFTGAIARACRTWRELSNSHELSTLHPTRLSLSATPHAASPQTLVRAPGRSTRRVQQTQIRHHVISTTTLFSLVRPASLRRRGRQAWEHRRREPREPRGRPEQQRQQLEEEEEEDRGCEGHVLAWTLAAPHGP